jgi:hydroxymethylbilane synthase
MTPNTPSPHVLRLGTRGSPLARVQADIAARALRENVGQACEVVVVKTTGDRVQDRPLAEIGGKALFAKELEDSLLAGEIDFAVHSMKDLPAELPAGLTLAAVLPREKPYDVLVLPNGKRLPKAAPRIGTSSVRRAAQARRAFRDVEILPLRGNVDTRLRKLDGGDYDAVLLSFAGLTRLGHEDRAGGLLSWLPALAQGAIGIETRIADAAIFAPLDDALARLCITCERAFQLGLGGSCHSPIAGLAEVAGGALHFHGEVLAHDGGDFLETRFDVQLGGNFAVDLAAVQDRARTAGRDLRPGAVAWLL